MTASTAGHGCKLLFAHAGMARDLLVGFVDEPWVKALQFDTLRRAPPPSASCVTCCPPVRLASPAPKLPTCWS